MLLDRITKLYFLDEDHAESLSSYLYFRCREYSSNYADTFESFDDYIEYCIQRFEM